MRDLEESSTKQNGYRKISSMERVKLDRQIFVNLALLNKDTTVPFAQIKLTLFILVGNIYTA